MPLNTKSFINTLIQNHYTHLCVVPCSFAKNVINEAINNDGIEYLPAASEAVACSIAAGLKMAGKKPIVIVQSSGLTNMASCITSLLKPYGVTFQFSPVGALTRMVIVKYNTSIWLPSCQH